VLVIAPRLALQLDRNWGDTLLEIPRGKWRNQFSGEVFHDSQLQLGEVLRRFPIALLVDESL